MQKVVGSSPIIRSRSSCKSAEGVADSYREWMPIRGALLERIREIHAANYFA